ncbi:MAG: NUDIX domain-containing protein [Candidatus Poribacteria bacterium]
MPNKVKIINESREYDGFFKIDKAVIQYEKFNGEMSPEITRLNFNRGNSVGVLLYNKDKDSIILVKQFRYPAYVNNGPGWLLELVAGMIDKGRDAISVARSELMEEAGYEVDDLKYLCQFYVSPGGSSEKVYLYIADCHRKIGQGGGKESENEDIQVLEIPLTKAIEMIRNGEICDAKTIIAIQWLWIELKRYKAHNP